MHTTVQHLLILGCGYVGERLAAACIRDGIRVSASTRSTQRADELAAAGIEAVVAHSPADLPDHLLASIDAILDSIPLERDASGMHAGQPRWLPDLVRRANHLHWAGYLSTTGVYGDAGGGWVDETSICHPASERGSERLLAEQSWLSSGLPAEVFRLAGIYGPDRNIIDRLQAGGYRAVAWQPPHYSSRIHVDDIVAALRAAMQKPLAGRIVNLADDLPLPHADYACEVARMIDAPPPVILDEATGERELSPAMLSFFRDNKRVSNTRLHAELLPELAYPNFRAGITSLMTDHPPS